MKFRVTLRYPDGAEISRPPDIEVEALPPIGTVMHILGMDFIVNGLNLDVRGNGYTGYTVQLKGLHSIN